ncbi:MAG: hypothetical protein PHR20_07290 [Bacteroidales bacterium]|nr:hypothetical protein [Bacteroidales bacterium]
MPALLIIFGLLSGCFFSVLVGLIGSRRNIGFTWAFLLSLLFTPFLGLLITLLSHERPYNVDKKYGCVGTFLAIMGFVLLLLAILVFVGVIVA